MTTVLEFHIPLSREDLLRQGDRSHYVVSECCTAAELASRLEECQSMLRGSPTQISESFDIFYSLLRDFLTVTVSVREDYWHIAIHGLEDYCRRLGEEEELGSLSPGEKKEMRNTLKMLVYVVVQLVEEFESEATKPDAQDMAVGGKGRRGGKKKSAGSTVTSRCSLDWSREREHVVEVLSQLAELELAQLWEPPTLQMMEDLSNLMASCCYKLLENPAITRDRAVREKVFHLMGMLIKKYNQALSVSLKVVQMLQHFEHLVTPLAQAVEMFANTFGAKNAVSEVIRELGSRDPRDLALDTSGTRCFATFLTEVAQLVPEAVLPTISVLLPHLSGESYTMRNGVLGVIGEVVGQVLNSSEMDEQAKCTRDQLLDKLEEHLHDVNAFVRSKTLQIWMQLCNGKAIPLPRQKVLLELVVGRLRDKSSNVRKNAVQLLSAFLTSNPFAGKLDEDDFQNKLKTEEEKLRSLLPPEEREEGGEAEEDDSPTAANDSSQQAGEVAKQMAIVQYLRDGLNFIQMMTKCIPVAVQLLGSKVTSDVLESLEFLSVAFEFQVHGSREGVRKALALVWSREQQVKDAVVNMYVRLYLNPQVDNPRMRTAFIVRNLIQLTQGASCGDLTSLEAMMALLVTRGHIPPAVVRMLWDTFTLKVPGSSMEDSRAAVLILSMAASADQEIVKSNVDILVSRGLGTGGEGADLLLAKLTCVALQKLANRRTQRGETAKKPFRLPPSHLMFQQIHTILTSELTNMETSHWSPLAEQAIATIYTLSDHPDEVCGALLKKLTEKVFGSDAPPAPPPPFADGTGVDTGVESGVPASTSVDTLPDEFDPEITSSQDLDQANQSPSPQELNPLLLSRLLFCAGHVAQWQLIHLEVNIAKELKRQRNLQETERENTAGEKGATPGPTPRSTASKSRLAKKTSRKEKSTLDSPNLEDEMGLTGAAADDIEAELMRKVCETEVGGAAGMLACFEPLIVAVVTNPSNYPCPALQASAALALAKFMLISSTLCDKYLQLLFTVLEKSPEPTIRANTIIAAGDLTFRYPNLIEPWTLYLYARLRDDSPVVRKNTLVVLTHLILNDMIKVKGQISAMALCLEDPEQKIADLAKLFFHELSKKGNAIYNVLPDIISNLSDPQKSTPQETFRSIVKYLFSFIQKDRQCESLVEKLCHRFRATRLTERQWRDLAHCLSHINFSERCVRRLQENFACFQDKLVDAEVFSSFTSIVSKAKKFAKPEVKAVVEELEKKLHEAHTKGLEEATEVTNTQPQQVAAPQEEEREGRGEEDDCQASKAGGSSDGPDAASSEGTEGLPQQVVADTGGAAAERGTEGEVLENKENNPGQGGPPQPITPPKKGKRKKLAKSTTRKKSSRKRLTEANKDTWSEDHRNSEDDFETDVLSSARKALTQSVQKSVRKSVRKNMVYSSGEEEDLEPVVKPSVKTAKKLLLSDEDD